jgi:thiamine biosynthesis lipoprotein
MAVATSGDYERFFEVDGVRYHHLLNPQTGYPAREAVSVTIWAPTALLADAYATAVFIMGPEKGMAFIERHPHIEGLIIYEQQETLVHKMSRGLAGHLEF